MTDDAPLTPPEENEAMAAELALGLLDGAEAEAAVARMSTDASFAQAVRNWHERLAGLALGLTPVMPPARARQAIRERLGHAVAPLTEDPAAPTAWWRGPWGIISGVLAVAVLAAVLILPGLRDVDSARHDYQAQLVSDDQALQVAAFVDGREMEIAIHSGAAPSGRDWEIWWIEPDGSAPISIGLVPREGNLRMTLPEGLNPSDAIRLALTDEPAGGSPTGQATGLIVAMSPLTPS